MEFACLDLRQLFEKLLDHVTIIEVFLDVLYDDAFRGEFLNAFCGKPVSD